MLLFKNLYSQLENAVKNRNLSEIVRELLEKEIPPSYIINEKTGDSLLHFIAAHGSLKLLDSVLREASVDEVNCKNLSDETALIQAVKARKQMVVHLLMNYQADPQRKDKQGNCAFEYCQSQSDPQINCTKKIMWHLTECADELAAISNDESFLNKLNILQKQKVALTDPVDADDNSLLHLILQYGSLKVINLVLSHTSPNELNIKNANRDTPLHQVCKSNSRIKTLILIAKGADPMLLNNMGITATSLIKDNKTLQLFLTDNSKKAASYIKAIEELERSVKDNRIEEMVIALTKNGFTLEEPIDHFDNSLLHWLMRHSPFHVIASLFKKCKITQINVQNSLGETPLMIAAGLGRQKAVSLLITHGADLSVRDTSQHTAHDWAQKFKEPIALSSSHQNQPTLYEHLTTIFSQENSVLEALSEEEKAQHLFQKFIEFIRGNNWLYDGTHRNFSQPFLLDCDAHKQYVVNCFDLAHTFASLLQAFGFKEVSTFIYKSMKSKAFSSKTPAIKGEFSCFDKEVQAKSFSEGYFFYDNHCVVTCQGIFFDPTFCCYYSDEGDIVDSYEMEEEKKECTTLKDNDSDEKSKNYINIYVNLDLAFQINHLQLQNTPIFHHQNTFQRLFTLKFISFLQIQFPEKEWHCLNRVDKIIFTSKEENHYFAIEFEENEICFQTKNISTEMLSDILIEWARSLPSFDVVLIVEASQNSLGTLMRDQLIQRGFNKNSIVSTTIEDKRASLGTRKILKVKRKK